MNVRRGDIVLVDFPYSNHTGSKYVQHLWYSQMFGISGLMIQFLLSLLAVLGGGLKHLLNILLMFQRLKGSEQNFASIQLFNVKI